MMAPANNDFETENARMIVEMGGVQRLSDLSRDWIVATIPYQYTYHFTWLGRPIIQLPQDVVAMQELIWRVKPKYIIETGVAHGGSLIFSASMLKLIGDGGRVIGIDIDIREHNRTEIESHPMADLIDLIQGSSVDEELVESLRTTVDGASAMVILDSNHTHEHVLRELELYSPLVTQGSYLIVMDTVIEDIPQELPPHRPWGPGDNPRTAVREFLLSNRRFEVDTQIESKLLLTLAPGGYLKCVAGFDEPTHSSRRPLDHSGAA